jgi:hypothetical protein
MLGTGGIINPTQIDIILSCGSYLFDSSKPSAFVDE